MPVADSVGTQKSKGAWKTCVQDNVCVPCTVFPFRPVTNSFQLFSHTPPAEHMPGMNGGHEAASENNRNGPEEKQAFMEDSTPLFPTLSF